MRLVALDQKATRTGLFVEQSLSDARALCPGLQVREIDRAYLEAVFADFADWHSYVSPIVSVHEDAAPFGDLIIDIAGVSHLFGDENQMLQAVSDRLRHLGFTVNGAIAGSVGAAWALSHFSPGRVVLENIEMELADLPVAALRISEEQVTGLMHMGLKRIGQLYDRDRKALQARFGASLILRLDQALGHVEERIRPRLPIAERYTERRLADPIGMIDDVLMIAHDLAIRLGLQLEAEGLGARSFHLFLYRVDHKVMTLSVKASRATRDVGHISRLFANRAERLTGEYDAGFGIDMIRLAASEVNDLTPTQIGAFGTWDGTQDLDQLYDRMASRFGLLSVTRSKPVNSYIPEQAIQLEPVIARTTDDPFARPGFRHLRPLKLLPNPEPIRVMAMVPDGPPITMTWRQVTYRFIKASGPERIGEEWGRSDFVLSKRIPRPVNLPKADEEDSDYLVIRNAISSRDYYIAEDDSGRRFWLFRDGLYEQTKNPGWYLHGFFS